MSPKMRRSSLCFTVGTQMTQMSRINADFLYIHLIYMHSSVLICVICGSILPQNGVVLQQKA